MKKLSQSMALKLLGVILRPIAAYCLRHGLKLQDLIEAAKGALVEVARKELGQEDSLRNASRITIVTGVHRRDVTRLSKDGSEPKYEGDLVTKVIGRWRSDSRFLTKDGEPRVISCDGPDSEFFALVRKVSTDVNPSSVLFELNRINAIQTTPRGLRLVVESYVPEGNPEESFGIYSRDINDLGQAVEGNVIDKLELPHFHARTEFDNVRPEAIEELKRWFLREGHIFHSRVREIVSKHDQDVNPQEDFKGKGVRVVLGAFSFVDEKRDREK